MNKQEAMEELEKIKAEAKELEKFIEQEEKKNVAQNGMLINSFMEEHYRIRLNEKACTEARTDFGNVRRDDIKDWNFFNTKENAEKFDNQLLALKKIWKWKTENDGDFIPDWEDERQGKYNIFWSNIYGLAIGTAVEYRESILLPYYSTKKIATEAIFNLTKEYMLLFDVILSE